MLKIYLKDIGYVFGIIIIGLFIFTCLNYFNIISDKVMSVLKILLPVIALGFGGFYLSKNSSKRGIVEGIKIGVLISIFILLISLLGFNDKFEWKNLIYYLILIISSMGGGIIAKQKKD